jgi:hypothetical protein
VFFLSSFLIPLFFCTFISAISFVSSPLSMWGQLNYCACSCSGHADWKVMTWVSTQTTEDINAPSLSLLLEIYRVIERDATKSSRLHVQSLHSIPRLLLLTPSSEQVNKVTAPDAEETSSGQPIVKCKNKANPPTPYPKTINLLQAYKVEPCPLSCSFVHVWNLVSEVKRKTLCEGIWEQIAEVSIWTKEG